MNTDMLRKLLRKFEAANLEFKRQWYELENPKKAEAAKGEMIKDILSLANGNTTVAGEESHLIIGVSNEFDEQGNRQLFDAASTKPITRQRILDIVNQYCDPAIEDLICEEVTLDGKKLLIITILPSPHIHETVRKLKTAKITYDEYTVFIRHAEGVRTASTKERLALQELKKLRFSETVNVPPKPFGAFIGALFLGLLSPKLITKEGDPSEKILSAQIVGGSIGGFLGWMIGSNYAEFKALPRTWKQATPTGKALGAMFGTAFSLGFWWLFKYWNRKRKKPKITSVSII